MTALIYVVIIVALVTYFIMFNINSLAQGFGRVYDNKKRHIVCAMKKDHTETWKQRGQRFEFSVRSMRTLSHLNGTYLSTPFSALQLHWVWAAAQHYLIGVRQVKLNHYLDWDCHRVDLQGSFENGNAWSRRKSTWS